MLKIQQMIAGLQPDPQRRKYADCTVRIKNIVQNFQNRNIFDYLRGIAYNISL